MKIKVVILVSSALLVFGVLYQSCATKSKNTFGNNGSLAITPQPFPGKDTTGITFPTDANTINDWIDKQYFNSIARHAWGIWAGLTANSNQVSDTSTSSIKDTLLIYETWMGTSELQTMMKNGNNSPSMVKYGRTKLERPKQFGHGAHRLPNLGTLAVVNNNIVDVQVMAQSNTNQWVTVNYSPNAASFALTTNIFNQDTLNNKLAKNGGTGAITPFPNSSITIKPTYLYVDTNGTDLIAIPVWPGIPNPPNWVGSFSGYWQYLYIDPTNTRGATKPIPTSTLLTINPNPRDSAIVNLQDFIYFAIDSNMAAYLNTQQESVQLGNDTAQDGDLAILMGMHVATKEISNWTWQTFFWVPDPANPPSPSSAFNYQQRFWNYGSPDTIVLSNAAAHYAVQPAYVMVWPGTSTSNDPTKVRPHFGFNPYLEASFGPSAFSGPNQLNSNYIFGVQTNCMSCHAMATIDSTQNFLGYVTDQYINPDSSIFKNYVKLDFAWSIQQSAFSTSSSSPINKVKKK